MTRDILSEYGPDSPSDQQPRATNGGDMPVKDIPYCKPVGPTNQMHKGPGLAGDNCGNAPGQGKH